MPVIRGTYPSSEYVVAWQSIVAMKVTCVFMSAAAVDNRFGIGIIIVTQKPAYWNHAPYGQETKPRSQVPSSPATGLIASPSRADHRRIVFDARVFRPARCGSGQVRDAASGAKRGTSGKPIRRPLRLFPSLVLPGTGLIPPRRSAGTDATEAGTEKSAQAHRRGDGFRPPPTAARSLSAGARSGFPSQRQIRYHRSSTQHRTCIDPQSKKTAVNEPLPHSVPQQEWVIRYEQLRSDALSRGHGIGSGFGLTLFLQQGMMAWMRACSLAVKTPTLEQAPPRPISSLSCDLRTQAVLILAGILLGNQPEANQCKPTCKR
jgi:hypothetical protein